MSHGRELYSHLPVLYGLGLNTMLDQITDPELEAYDGLLRVDRDPREGQFFLNFDRLHGALEAAIETYEFERPTLFESNSIDRSSLCFFNGREVKVSRIHNWSLDNPYDLISN